jgi:hypothetical protein
VGQARAQARTCHRRPAVSARESQQSGIRRRAGKAKAHRQRHASQPPAEETVTVNPNQITTERHREVGPVHVGHQFWLRLGLDEILKQHGLGR